MPRNSMYDHERLARNQHVDTVDAATTMTPSQRVLYVAPSAARTITLPDPALWAGQFKTVVGIENTDDNDVTVAASGNEDVTFAGAVLDDNNDNVTVYSDGFNVWIVGGTYT